MLVFNCIESLLNKYSQIALLLGIMLLQGVNKESALHRDFSYGAIKITLQLDFDYLSVDAPTFIGISYCATALIPVERKLGRIFVMTE